MDGRSGRTWVCGMASGVGMCGVGVCGVGFVAWVSWVCVVEHAVVHKDWTATASLMCPILSQNGRSNRNAEFRKWAVYQSSENGWSNPSSKNGRSTSVSKMGGLTPVPKMDALPLFRKWAV